MLWQADAMGMTVAEYEEYLKRKGEADAMGMAYEDYMEYLRVKAEAVKLGMSMDEYEEHLRKKAEAGKPPPPPPHKPIAVEPLGDLTILGLDETKKSGPSSPLAPPPAPAPSALTPYNSAYGVEALPTDEKGGLMGHDGNYRTLEQARTPTHMRPRPRPRHLAHATSPGSPRARARPPRARPPRARPRRARPRHLARASSPPTARTFTPTPAPHLARHCTSHAAAPRTPAHLACCRISHAAAC
jgi:hypothetical protein